MIAATTDRAHVAAARPDSTTSSLRSAATAAGNVPSADLGGRWAGVVPAAKWPNGVVTNGAATNGAVTSGAVTNGDLPNEIEPEGAVPRADVSGLDASGSVVSRLVGTVFAAANIADSANIVNSAGIGMVSLVMVLAAMVLEEAALRGPAMIAAILVIGVIGGLPAVAADIAALLALISASIASVVLMEDANVDIGAGITAVTAGPAAHFIGVRNIADTLIIGALAGRVMATAVHGTILAVTRISRDTMGVASGLIDGSRFIARSAQVARTCGPILEGTEPADLPAAHLEWGT